MSSVIPDKISESDNNVKGKISDSPGWKIIQTGNNADMKKNYPGNNIKKHRLAASLTQGQLATKAQITAATVEKLENGKMALTHDYIIRLGKALNIPAWEVITESQEICLHGSNLAIADTLTYVFKILAEAGIVRKADLHRQVIRQHDSYQSSGQKTALLVMEHLEAFLNDESHGTEPPPVAPLSRRLAHGSA